MPTWLSTVIAGLILTLLSVNAAVLYAIRGDLRSLREFLFGPDGKNGLRGRMESVETDVKNHERRLTQIEAREEAA